MRLYFQWRSASFYALIVSLGVGLALLSILPTTMLAAHAASSHAKAANSCGNWTINSPAPIGHGSAFGGISADAANDVWAVGSYVTTQGKSLALIERWDGSKWNVVPHPNPSGYRLNDLYAVAALSSNNVWAVGIRAGNPGTATLIEHWNGKKWVVVASPGPGYRNELDSIAAVSANDIWAVGHYSTQNGPFETLAEHWNGTQWSVVSSPSPSNGTNYLNGVTAVSANDVWAVGDYGDGAGVHTLIEQWNGSQWSVVASPTLPYHSSLASVTAVSSSNIWAVGNVSNANDDTSTLTEQWNGSQWNVVATPTINSFDYYFADVAAISPTDIWAVGNDDGSAPLIEQWNGSQWNVVSSPNPTGQFPLLGSITTVPHTSQLWSVGRYSPPGQNLTTLAEFYC